jgi:hypothetical protein
MGRGVCFERGPKNRGQIFPFWGVARFRVGGSRVGRFSLCMEKANASSWGTKTTQN